MAQMDRCGDISTAAAPAPGPRRRRALWRAIRLVASILLGFVVLRSRVGARYRIVSDSMAPTLVSVGADGADHVWVDKTAFWFRDPEPLELVVLRTDSDPLPVVKRLIAIGPATVRLAGGDVFVRREGRARLERLRKEPDRDEGLVRARWSAEDPAPPFAPGVFVDQRLRLDVGATVRTVTPWVVRDPAVTTSFVQDFGAAFEVDWPDGVTAIVCTLDHGGRRRMVRFHADGRIEGPGPGRFVGTGQRPRRLRFLRLDGRLIATAGSQSVSADDPLPPIEGPVVPGDRPYAVVEWRAEGREGLTVELECLELLSDVHWPDEDESFELAGGELFVLGDNPPQSRDSRSRRGTPFRRSDLVGGVSRRLRGGDLSGL